MATNGHILLFYILLHKLKLVSHFLSNRHKIFTQATLIVLLKKSGFDFWISISDAELVKIKLWDCEPQGAHSTFPLHSSTFKVDTQNWKPLFYQNYQSKNFMHIG